MSYDHLARYYATADIFCAPATGAESFGIVLLEAMAAGKPVVASDIDGYNGIIRHGRQGLLFPKRDTEAMASALRFLVLNPELAQQLGKTGRRMVEQYRWSSVAKQVESYYYECIAAVKQQEDRDGYAWQRAV